MGADNLGNSPLGTAGGAAPGARLASHVLAPGKAESPSDLGSAYDNTAENMRVLGTRWHELYDEFSQPPGAGPAGAARLIAEWWEHAALANVVVIAGHHRESTQWLAESFAHHWKKWKEIRCATRSKLGGLSSRQIIEDDLAAWPGRCLVVDAWFYLDSDLRFGDLAALKKLVEEHSHDRHFGLVFWTEERTVRNRPGWPENIHLYSLPTAPAVPSRPPDVGFFEKLFGGDITSILLVAKLREKTIQQTLARICVLFGDLPEADVEELMAAMLGEQTVTLNTGEGENKGQSHRLQDLWSSGKRFFLQEAGLVCRTEETPCRIGFLSLEVRALASEAAWKDARPMIDIFSKIEETTVLFADESTRHRRDLYEGYIGAAVMLARRAPSLYGARWLEAISEQYIRWSAGQAPEIKLDEHDNLFSVLVAIAENREHHAHLRRRFTQRMGYLCSHLSRDSLPIVEDFFHRLASRGLHALLWMLLVELRDTTLDFSKWGRRILNENADAGREALRQMAGASTVSRQAARDYHSFLEPDLPGSDQPSARPSEKAALAFPTLILGAWYERAMRGGDMPIPFGQLLDFELDRAKSAHATIRAYWASCFRAKSFGEAVRFWSGEGGLPDDQPLALALFQTVSLGDAPDDIRVALQMAGEVRREDPARWQRLRGHWAAIAELLKGRLRSLPRDDAHHDQRRHLDRIIYGSQQLSGL